MNLQECWRGRIQEASRFQAKNHSLSNERMKKELQGERRLDPPAQLKKDKKILDRVRRAINCGDYGNTTPQKIGKSIDYLRSRGYTDFDMLTMPTIEIFPTVAPVIEVAAAAD